jgi:hypothetical protein
MTEPLKKLEDKDVEWCWLEQHQQAYGTVKKALATAPVLRYYDVSKEVTIECDASDSGLGAVLMQDGQPVVFCFEGTLRYRNSLRPNLKRTISDRLGNKQIRPVYPWTRHSHHRIRPRAVKGSFLQYEHWKK